MLYGDKTDNPNVKYTVSFVYAHGELETLLGTDIIVSNSGKGYPPGVYSDVMQDNDGNCFPVVVFSWTDGRMPRGLVCLCDDMDGLRYAAECFSQRVAVM